MNVDEYYMLANESNLTVLNANNAAPLRRGGVSSKNLPAVVQLAQGMLVSQRPEEVAGQVIKQLEKLYPATEFAILRNCDPTCYQLHATEGVNGNEIDFVLAHGGSSKSEWKSSEGRSANGVSHPFTDWATPSVVPAETDVISLDLYWPPSWIVAAWSDRVQDLPEAYELQAIATLVEAAYSNADEKQELREQCTHDPLTGLLNRQGVNEVMAQETSRAKRHQSELSLLYIDLDHFKGINDNYGHTIGDLALCHVSRVLRDSVRPYDYVGRLGGDEFVLVLPGATADEAKIVAARVHHALAKQSMQVDDLTLYLELSVGISNLKDDGDLIAAADQKMYAAKNSKRT